MAKNLRIETGLAIDGEIELKELSANPVSPSTGSYKLYMKNGKLHQLDENGEKSEIGALKGFNLKEW